VVVLLAGRRNGRAFRFLCLTLAIGASVALCEPLLHVTAAHAAEVDDKRAEAAALESQIADNGRKLDALNEQLNTAQLALDTANQAIVDADAGVAAAQAKAVGIRAAVAERAAQLYMSGGATQNGVSTLDTNKARDLTTREQYTDIAGQRDKQLQNELVRAREALAQKKVDAESARAAAQTQKTQIEGVRADVQAGDQKQRELLGKVNADIADLVAQAEAARQAQEAATAAARLKLQPAQTTSGGANLASASPPPAPSARVGAVLAYAYAQLGKPYCYGGAGPSCFDCSGLSMMAWAQAGVMMSHGSNDQLASFPRVPLNQLQPGDLVFWDGHVGIYVGNSSVLHAPYTGTVVQITPIWPGVIGAVRPG
jgi:cell wall-associated NlpC family hydrolase